MSNRTFKSIFAGKEVYLDEKLDTESGLLVALESHGIITSYHKTTIKVRRSLL